VFTGRGYVPCRIKQIRPVNLAQFKLDKASQRHVDSMQRDNASPAPAPASSAGSP
jgi:hypothetical protein